LFSLSLFFYFQQQDAVLDKSPIHSRSTFTIAKNEQEKIVKKKMLAFVTLVLIIVLVAPMHVALGSAPSYSHSESHSHSPGVCPESGLVAATPRNASLYHGSIYDWPCGYVFDVVDSSYGVQNYYPCIYPGGLTLAPTSVTLQLSVGGSNDRGNDWISVMLLYNFTHYNRLHPDKVLDCFNEPTPGPHNPPFLKWSQIGSYRAGCDRICGITNYYLVQCSDDYLTAKSGEYYVEIPYVGRYNFNVSVCFRERFQNDYAVQCRAQLSTCPADTAVYTSGASISLDGVRFSSLWTMTLAVAALLLL
jgi:hypothetical protein